MCVLPVQCKRCGAVFDLSYDLEELERRGTDFPGTRVSERVLRESLCWDCRKFVLKKLMGKGKGEDGMDELLVELE